MEYSIDTNLGCIEVSKEEFEDVKNRHLGVEGYGKDWTIDDYGQPVKWNEEVIGNETIGGVHFQPVPHTDKLTIIEIINKLKSATTQDDLDNLLKYCESKL